MVEVEKKFQPTKKQLALLLNGAQFVRKEKYRDTYYDLFDLSNVSRGRKLRKRGNKYELKIEIPNPKKKGATRNVEITDESEILRTLGFDENADLNQVVKENMTDLCSFENTREVYTKDGFTIDIDSADFGYEVCEIELQVESEEWVEGAEARIKQLAKEVGMSRKPLPGKLMECLRITQPKIYDRIMEIKKENKELKRASISIGMGELKMR